MEERACSLHISRSLKFLSVVLVLSVLYRSIQKVYSRLKHGEPSVMLKAQWPALYNTVHVWNVRICMACHFGVSALFPSVFLRYFLQLFCAVGGNYL